MDDSAAILRLRQALEKIDAWADLYERRWGKRPPYVKEESLDRELRDSVDGVRTEIHFARTLIAAMGENTLAEQIVEGVDLAFGDHRFESSRLAILQALGILEQRDELESIVGPTGPKLSASELHPVIWNAAAALWDGNHHRQAVQTAASALEARLQEVAGPAVSGENLASVFSVQEPTTKSPRLRIVGLEPGTNTWKSAHEGGAAMVRGAFLAVRNLMAHPGWPDPQPGEALEMLAVLSFVAHLIDRAEVAIA